MRVHNCAVIGRRVTITDVHGAVWRRRRAAGLLVERSRDATELRSCCPPTKINKARPRDGRTDGRVAVFTSWKNETRQRDDNDSETFR